MAELSKEQLEVSAAFLQKLIGLGIKAHLTRVEPGPVLTGYHFKLDYTVPISKILKKAEDFALAASVEKVTIQRVEGEIVIYAANRVRKLIELKDYMYWFCTDKDVAEMAIPLPLGVDTLGNKKAIDVVDQPHVLLAGATGSGKSVYEAAVLSCLSMVKVPKELRLHLVDTKAVDLPLFRSLPHVENVVEDLKDFHTLMNSLLNMIYKRMEKLKNASCRNIREYHSLMGEKKTMPYHLLMIDEFGDLLLQDRAAKKSKESAIAKLPNVDTWLARIVQISRAAGVHVIAGTQRTSVKVVSGDIKANFPCRISLRLSTAADSITILGEGGAENLLGKGDMLIGYEGVETLRRYHGPFVDINDIARIVDEQEFLRDQFVVMRGAKLSSE